MEENQGIDFGIEKWSYASEEELLPMILQRVDELIATDIDLLMSYLYRLDVSESSIQGTLKNQENVPVNEGLAQLIYQRQIQRLASRQKYRQEPIEGWEY